MVKGHPRDSGYERNGNDWYQEPREAIDLLLDHEIFSDYIFDPACGEGNIPNACQARGMTAFGSDIVDRGKGFPVLDFFSMSSGEVPNIISNPPFDTIEPFIHHALKLATMKVAILGRLALLEGKKRKATLYDTTPFARVWVFSRRISMPPGGRGIVAKGGSIPFAWFVWDKSHPTGKKAEVGFLP